MLLFITSAISKLAVMQLFQNISCYCLSSNSTCFHSLIDISKHLMLLFIKDDYLNDNHPLLFQNISCYCLSEIVRKGIEIQYKFQNISCYCLSHAFPRFLVSPLLFFPYIFYISPFFTSQHPYPGTPYLSSHKSLNFSSFPGFFILFPPGKNPIIISLNFLLLPPLHFPKLLLQTHCHSST